MKIIEANFFWIEDQYGRDRVMAKTPESAIAAFHKYRRENKLNDSRIRDITMSLDERVIFAED